MKKKKKISIIQKIAIAMVSSVMVFGAMVGCSNKESSDAKGNISDILETKYVLTVKAENGRVFANADSFKYGEIASLTASPNVGYKFFGWFIEEIQVGEELTLNHPITADTTVTALFLAGTNLVQFVEDSGVTAVLDVPYGVDPVQMLNRDPFFVYGKIVVGWDTPIIQDDITIVRAKYQFDLSKDVVISIDGESKVYHFGEEVEASSNNPSFSYWADEEGNPISVKEKLTFKAFNNTSIMSLSGEVPEATNIPTITENSCDYTDGIVTGSYRIEGVTFTLGSTSSDYGIYGAGMILTDCEITATPDNAKEVLGASKVDDLGQFIIIRYNLSSLDWVNTYATGYVWYNDGTSEVAEHLTTSNNVNVINQLGVVDWTSTGNSGYTLLFIDNLAQNQIRTVSHSESNPNVETVCYTKTTSDGTYTKTGGNFGGNNSPGVIHDDATATSYTRINFAGIPNYRSSYFVKIQITTLAAGENPAGLKYFAEFEVITGRYGPVHNRQLTKSAIDTYLNDNRIIDILYDATDWEEISDEITDTYTALAAAMTKDEMDQLYNDLVAFILNYDKLSGLESEIANGLKDLQDYFDANAFENNFTPSNWSIIGDDYNLAKSAIENAESTDDIADAIQSFKDFFEGVTKNVIDITSDVYRIDSSDGATIINVQIPNSIIPLTQVNTNDSRPYFMEASAVLDSGDKYIATNSDPSVDEGGYIKLRPKMFNLNGTGGGITRSNSYLFTIKFETANHFIYRAQFYVVEGIYFPSNWRTAVLLNFDGILNQNLIISDAYTPSDWEAIELLITQAKTDIGNANEKADIEAILPALIDYVKSEFTALDIDPLQATKDIELNKVNNLFNQVLPVSYGGEETPRWLKILEYKAAAINTINNVATTIEEVNAAYPLLVDQISAIDVRLGLSKSSSNGYRTFVYIFGLSNRKLDNGDNNPLNALIVAGIAHQLKSTKTISGNTTNHNPSYDVVTTTNDHVIQINYNAGSSTIGSNNEFTVGVTGTIKLGEITYRLNFDLVNSLGTNNYVYTQNILDGYDAYPPRS